MGFFDLKLIIILFLVIIIYFIYREIVNFNERIIELENIVLKYIEKDIDNIIEKDMDKVIKKEITSLFSNKKLECPIKTIKVPFNINNLFGINKSDINNDTSDVIIMSPIEEVRSTDEKIKTHLDTITELEKENTESNYSHIQTFDIENTESNYNDLENTESNYNNLQNTDSKSNNSIKSNSSHIEIYSNNESVNFIGFKKTKRINTNTNFLDSIDKSCIKLSSMIIEKNYPLNYRRKLRFFIKK